MRALYQRVATYIDVEVQDSNCWIRLGAIIGADSVWTERVQSSQQIFRTDLFFQHNQDIIHKPLVEA